MTAAVDNVHHRNRKSVTGDTAQETIQGNIQGDCCCSRAGNGYCQDRIGSQSGLILGSVCIDHCLINGINIGCIHSLQSLIDYSIDIFYSLLNTLAQISALIAVSQFQCLELTGRCSAGSHAASDGTVYQSYLCFYGRIASGIQNLSSNDFFNL